MRSELTAGIDAAAVCHVGAVAMLVSPCSITRRLLFFFRLEGRLHRFDILSEQSLFQNKPKLVGACLIRSTVVLTLPPRTHTGVKLPVIRPQLSTALWVRGAAPSGVDSPPLECVARAGM